MELQLLLTQYEFLQEQFAELHAKMDELLEQIPSSNQLFDFYAPRNFFILITLPEGHGKCIHKNAEYS